MRFPSPEEWLGLVAEFKSSGLQQKEFCGKHNLSVSTFQYWLYRKTKRVQVESESSPRFLPVTVVASPASQTRGGRGGVLEASLRSGVLLRFTVGTDTRYLAELFAALG